MTRLLPFAMVMMLLADCSQDSSAPRILYEASDGHATNIYTLDPSDGSTRQITHGTAFDGNPAWSPDRKRIVFSSLRDDRKKNDLFVMDAHGDDVRRLTDTVDVSEFSPRFSPDGTRIAYSRDSDDGWAIWEMAADGTQQRQLTPTYDFAELPAWTPDGAVLYYSAIEHDADRGDAHTDGRSYLAQAASAHVYSVDLADLEVRTRIRTSGTDACPHLSPDGNWLLYASTVTADNTLPAIFAHATASEDTTGTADKPLTGADSRNDYGDPSPDGGSIVFTSDRDGNVELYLMNGDGSDERRLTNTPDLRENVPDW